MSFETVRIYCEDQVAVPLDGVLVRFFESDGTTFVTQQYTSVVGGEAYAEVTMEGDDPAITYVIRLSKTGVAFDGTLGAGSATPQTISVSSVLTNDFDTKGQTFSRPVASDPRLCRVSGYVRDHAQRAVENYRITITPFVPDSEQQFSMRVISGDLIANKEQALVTDEDGYVVFDVMRSAEYTAVLEDNTLSPRSLYIPDASSAALADILFPVIRSVVFTTPMSLLVGETDTATVVITCSDGREFLPSDQVLVFSSSDDAIATVQESGDDLIITGISAGTATITAALDDESVLRYPGEPQTLVPLTVAVT